MKHDFLYLIWKNPENRRNYTIGKLIRENEYKFEYSKDYEEALKAGWKLIQAFPVVKVYQSRELFPMFSSRLPDPKRRDIKEVLGKYGLDEYDGYELLKRSGGRLPIDTYEFIDPIFPEDETVQRDFYVVGIRHVLGCQGEECVSKQELHLNMELYLKRETDNSYDTNAVLVRTCQGKTIGYIPRYYSESVAFRLQANMSYLCTIIELNTEKDCQNCVKVRLVMPREGK